MYKIVLAPDEILRTATEPVTFFDDKLKKIIEEMRVTLIIQKNPEGVGLAANQVGLPYRLFLARFVASRKEPVRVFINPEIIDHSEDFQIETKKSPLEGCLSLPKYYGNVRRWKWIKVKYTTPCHPGGSEATDRILQKEDPIGSPAGGLQGDSFLETIETFEDFPAVVIQHEMDHLNGKIFVERILEQKGTMYKISGKDKDGKEEWEEVEL